MSYPVRPVAFEKLMYFLDQPGYPNCLGIRLRFTGKLNREAALAAAQTTFERHPGFQVTLDPSRLKFVDRGEPFRNFRWVEVTSLAETPSLAPTDIHRDGGGVFWFTSGPEGCEVSLIGHHALTDGIGGLQVIHEWLLEYDRLIAGGKHKLPQLDPSRLETRGKLHFLRWSFLRKLPYQSIALFGASKFIFRRFVPLVMRPEPPDRPDMLPYPCLLTQRLPLDFSRRIRQCASDRGCAVNDLLACALFRAIARWRERHAGGAPTDWIRLLVPMSIRTLADRRLTACNRVSLVQIDRQPRQTEDLSRLLPSVSREMRVIRQWQLDRTFLFALRLASVIPGQLRRMARQPRGRATSLLTNLGDPLDRLPLKKDGRSLIVGGLRCQGMEMIAPTFRGTPVTVAVASFLGELTCCFNFNPRVVSADETNALWVEMESALRELVSMDPPATVGSEP